MKVRLLFASCAAIGALAVAPAAAGACASVGAVHSFTGHAFMSFGGTASGPIEGSGGSETISLDRKVTNLGLKLNHKVVGKGPYKGVVIFSGKARTGNVSVQDSFSLDGDSGSSSAKETYGGSPLASLGSASLSLDTENCLYALTATFGATTMFSGDQALRAGTGVSVSAFSEHEKIPGNLHLIGGVGPDAYLSCPGDPILTGQPCIQFSGGWATEFAELKQCGAYPPEGNCASSNKPAGDGKFTWVLKPQ